MKKLKEYIAITTLVITGSVSAASVQSNLSVSSLLENSCIISVADVDFGAVVPNESVVKITKNQPLNVLCSVGTAYSVKIPFNENSVGGQRFMKSDGPDKLAYSFYRTAMRPEGNRWGDGSFGTVGAANTGTGVYQVYPLFPGMMQNQFVKAGVYNDTVTVEVDY